MYASHIKKAIILFIVSLVMFSLCFTMHISATTSDPAENTSSQEVSSEAVSSEATSEVVSTDDPSEDVSSDSSETTSTESTDSATSDASTTESTDSAASEQSTVIMSSVPISSGEVSSLVVSTASDGGAPDHTYESEWNEKQSYVYEGSYVGLSSATASEEEKEEIQTTNQSSTAQRYAKYAKIGMIIFGLLTIGCVAFLIYYNLKVRKSKKLHPEWYPKKEKVAPKHGKH